MAGKLISAEKALNLFYSMHLVLPIKEAQKRIVLKWECETQVKLQLSAYPGYKEFNSKCT